MMRQLSAAMLLSVAMLRMAAGQQVFPGAEWETATPASQSVNAAKLALAKHWLATHNSKTGLVARNGRIIAEWYFDDADQNSKFAAYSTSKSLASLATGLAIEAGKLSLDDTVGIHLATAEPAEKKAVTVRQLLSMTSGIENNAGIGQREDLYTYALTKAPMVAAPGEKWDYNNTGLALLSPVFAQATGKKIDDFLNERVFRPIGIPADDWTWDRREDLPLPYSGCHMTGRSLARLGLLVLRNGKWEDKQLVPAKWLVESVAPSQTLNPAYGYLWWNNTTKKWPSAPRDAFAALGRWDNNIMVVPSLDLVVIRQSDLAPAPGHNIGEYLRLVCDAVEQ